MKKYLVLAFLAITVLACAEEVKPVKPASLCLQCEIDKLIQEAERLQTNMQLEKNRFEQIKGALKVYGELQRLEAQKTKEEAKPEEEKKE